MVVGPIGKQIGKQRAAEDLEAGSRNRVSTEEMEDIARGRTVDQLRRWLLAAFSAGAAVGLLGGMIGLGGV